MVWSSVLDLVGMLADGLVDWKVALLADLKVDVKVQDSVALLVAPREFWRVASTVEERAAVLADLTDTLLAVLLADEMVDEMAGWLVVSTACLTVWTSVAAWAVGSAVSMAALMAAHSVE